MGLHRRHGPGEPVLGQDAGTPVVTFGLGGAWAQLRAVDTGRTGTVPEGADPLDGVLDTIGGPTLVAAFDRLAEGGTLVALGHSSGAGETFGYGALFGGPGTADRSIWTFYLGAHPDLSADLTRLAAQVAAGDLDPGISWRGDWHDVTTATRALLDRTLAGKAVADVT
ncbi:zinc-binding dehydrogenase [Pseudonocardia sediminis]|uniref:zinc-binding dehydrogenase n=1 Tax=Pseudonocardia sediminis TaxID=1397368 RepID=UPI001F5F108D|nr:zinc-binding dehydrogenase [Pseudonocardia sediminis]